MSATIRQLLDEDNNKVYPVSVADAVYMKHGSISVQQVFDDLQEGNQKVSFPSDGQIKKELSSGDIVLTTFNADNTAVETTTDKDGTLLQTKTIKFNDDGTIEITLS